MKNIPQNIKILIGAVIAVVIVFFVVRAFVKPQPPVQEPVIEIPTEEPVAKTGWTWKPAPVVEDTPVVPKLSYTDAVAQYKNTRIQFVGDNCQATPARQSFKVGTSIMLDNRTPKPATISIGSSVYLVEAYGYHIVDLVTAGTFTANCNDQKNVLTLIVQ